MDSNKIYLVTTLKTDRVSGGNIYNKELINALNKNGQNAEIFYTENLKHDLELLKECKLIVDSICINSKFIWSDIGIQKIIFLIHMLPSEAEAGKISENEEYVLTHYPCIYVSNGKSRDRYNKTCVIEPGKPEAVKVKQQYKEIPNLFLVVANMNKAKGFDRLVDALARIKKSNWECHIYGEIVDREYFLKISEKIRENNLTDKIKFKGMVNHDDLLQKISDYDLLLHLSDHENNSMAIIESMAAGVPFISTPTGNYLKFSRFNCGCISKGFSSIEIAELIDKYMSSSIDYKLLVQNLSNYKFNTWEDNANTFLKFANSVWN